MFIICDAARKFPGISWRNYDKQFRIQQAISCQVWSKLNSDLLWGLIAVPLKPESSHAAAQVLTQTGVCFSDNREHCNAAKCRHLRLCSISVRGCTRNGAAQNTIIFEPKKLLLTTMQPTKIKKIKLANSPIKISVLQKFLRDNPSLQIAEELINGFQFGFRLHYHGPLVKMEAVTPVE